MTKSTSFSVNRGENCIHIQREFYAIQEKVWKAWTTRELLDKWWAPEPYRSQTKSIDFRQDGLWFYAFIDLDSWLHWYIVNFKEIIATRKLSFYHSFCNENVVRNPYLPTTFWEHRFYQNSGKTTADISIHFKNNFDMNQYLYREFEANISSIFKNLDEVLATTYIPNCA